jgi:hypothetical protein
LQRSRKKTLKEEYPDLNWTEKDHTYYNPKYFKYGTHPISGDAYYEYLEKNKYESNYWQDREKGNWDNLPKIFDDDCQAFYE